jgi:hypothetical protein
MTTTLRERYKKEIQQQRDREQYEECEYARERERILVVRNEILKSLRPASTHDYVVFLKAYIASGASPSHYYSYKMPRDSIFVAKDQFTLHPLYGAHSMSIIVPKNVDCFCYNARGHNTIYFEDGKLIGHFVPVYSDTLF